MKGLFNEMHGMNIEESISGNPNLKGIIADLDGTLYDQTPLRWSMFGALVKHFFCRAGQWRQLYGLFLFRRIREKKEFAQTSYEEQLEYAAHKAKLDKTELSDTIQYWMFQYPLGLVHKYANEHLLALLAKEQQKGKKIIIYSDYPVEEKLQSLGVIPDYIFYPGKNGITCLKPSKEAMECILSTVHMKAEELIFIGDRQEKDGVSAQLVGMNFTLV
jgi:FMN phosphatase YigB (HAD superfamily)